MIKSNKKGFTLIELLVVIAIIGLLSTLAVVSLNNARSKARDARRTSDLKTIQSALELYKGDSSNSAIFNMPAAGAGAWLTIGTTGGALASYLPGGMPVDPSNSGANIYTLCTNETVGGPMNYILASQLENTTSVSGGSIGDISTGGWLAADCLNSTDPSTAALPATDVCATAGLFCLGDVTK
ncbi:MAG: type II secretion system protein [Candidatus Komeilibacteria bacterium]|nr:type II secretion system protein [Candidatus Komeilibacteria bacterium]